MLAIAAAESALVLLPLLLKLPSKSWPSMSLHIACRRQTLASSLIFREFIEVDIERQDQSKSALDADCVPDHLFTPGQPPPNSYIPRQHGEHVKVKSTTVEPGVLVLSVALVLVTVA